MEFRFWNKWLQTDTLYIHGGNNSDYQLKFVSEKLLCLPKADTGRLRWLHENPASTHSNR